MPRKKKEAAPAQDEKGTPSSIAKAVLNPVSGAAVITTEFTKRTFGAVDVGATMDALHDRVKAVRGGDLSSVETMLTAQAASLNTIFLELVNRSCANLGEYIEAVERYLRLALKAQAQCRATLETLAAIKNPPVVIAKQANIAAGHQQVNNAGSTRERAHARAENSASVPNGLLEANGGAGERLDFGEAGAAIGGDSALETVGAIDGSAHG